MFAFRPRRDGPPLPQGLLLAALLFDFFLAASLYNAFIPVFEQPDEHGHYFFAQHVAQTGELPVQVSDVDARGPWEQEGSQPPLYYYLAAPLVTLAGAHLEEDELWYNHQNSMGTPSVEGNENRFIHSAEREGWPWQGYALAVHLGRLLSTLMGMFTLFCIWGIARRVLPGRRWLALACVALVGFNPQFLALSSAFSNDNAIVALSAATLLLLLQLADGRDPGRVVPLLAITAGLAPLAKLSGLALLGFTLLSLAWLAWRRRDPRWLLATAGPVIFAAALLSGWWYWRNIQLYGSLTGLNFMLPEQMGRSWRLERWLREEAAGEMVGIWWSSWGLFGWFTVLMPRWIYHTITGMAGLALVGLGLAWRERGQDQPGRLDDSDWIAWPQLGWLLLWAGIVSVSLLRWLTISKGGQGRLLFPAIATLAILLVAGWRRLFAPALEALGRRFLPSFDEEAEDPEAAAILDAERGDTMLAGLLIATLYALAAYALLFVIRPAYAHPPIISQTAIPASATPVDLVFGEGLRLVAAEHPERVTAGEDFPVTLYWQAERELERDGYVAMFAMRQWPNLKKDSLMWQSMVPELGYPGRGTTPPRLLRPGPGAFVDRRLLTTPEVDQHVAGRLVLSIFDPDTDSSWPIRGQDGTTWVSEFAIDAPDADSDSLPTGPPLASFDNGLRVWLAPQQFPPIRGGLQTLAWYDITSPNSTSLVWHVDQPLQEDLQIFVHILDEDGNFLEAFDGTLGSSHAYPARYWRTGEVVGHAASWWPVRPTDQGVWPDERWVGTRYQLRFGLYRLSDGTRIPAYDAAGERYPDDAIRLHDVELAEQSGGGE